MPEKNYGKIDGSPSEFRKYFAVGSALAMLTTEQFQGLADRELRLAGIQMRDPNCQYDPLTYYRGVLALGYQEGKL